MARPTAIAAATRAASRGASRAVPRAASGSASRGRRAAETRPPARAPRGPCRPRAGSGSARPRRSSGSRPTRPRARDFDQRAQMPALASKPPLGERERPQRLAAEQPHPVLGVRHPGRRAVAKSATLAAAVARSDGPAAWRSRSRRSPITRSALRPPSTNAGMRAGRVLAVRVDHHDCLRRRRRLRAAARRRPPPRCPCPRSAEAQHPHPVVARERVDRAATSGGAPSSTSTTWSTWRSGPAPPPRAVDANTGITRRTVAGRDAAAVVRAARARRDGAGRP